MGAANPRRYIAVMTLAGLRQWEVADALGYSDGVFSRYVNGHRPLPDGFGQAFDSYVKEATGRTANSWLTDAIAPEAPPRNNKRAREVQGANGSPEAA